MVYQRYQNSQLLSKAEKIELMQKYVDYYSKRISQKNLSELNVKIPREVFSDILDEVGTCLVSYASKVSRENGPVKEFLQNNPLPPHMETLLPDEFRAFSLLLNALKQWVSAESAATDRFILGGTARETCRSAVTKCIVTGEELGERPELHHPMRDGRPPILLSKKGHDTIEQNQTVVKVTDDTDDIMMIMKRCKKERHMSWVLIREGCNAIINRFDTYRPLAKSHANKIIFETGLSAQEVLDCLDRNNL